MKDIDEFTQSVFNKSERIITHRHKVRKKIAVSMGTLSAIVLIVSGLYTTEMHDKPAVETEALKAEAAEQENCCMDGAAAEAIKYIDVRSEKNNYTNTISDAETVLRIISWLDKLVAKGSTVDNSTFTITITDNTGQSTVYLPQEDNVYIELMEIINNE